MTFFSFEYLKKHTFFITVHNTLFFLIYGFIRFYIYFSGIITIDNHLLVNK